MGRPSRWGNPYVAQSRREEDRLRAIASFEEHALRRRAEDPAWLLPLQGKDLVCWCAPKSCHADVLLELANPSCEECRDTIPIQEIVDGAASWQYCLYCLNNRWG